MLLIQEFCFEEMATKRNVRAAALNLEKATKELANCSEADQRIAKHKLEEEMAEAKRWIHQGKKDHVDVEKLGHMMGSARLVIKMSEKMEAGKGTSGATAVDQTMVSTGEVSTSQTEESGSDSRSFVTGKSQRISPPVSYWLGLKSTLGKGPIIELPITPPSTGESQRQVVDRVETKTTSREGSIAASVMTATIDLERRQMEEEARLRRRMEEIEDEEEAEKRKAEDEKRMAEDAEKKRRRETLRKKESIEKEI